MWDFKHKKKKKLECKHGTNYGNPPSNRIQVFRDISRWEDEF